MDTPRPPRLKRAQDAAAYDKWFLAEVEAGIKEADDPNTVMVPHSVVKKDMAKQRKKLLARIATGNKGDPSLAARKAGTPKKVKRAKLIAG